jgi:hypothetical protein
VKELDTTTYKSLAFAGDEVYIMLDSELSDVNEDLINFSKSISKSNHKLRYLIYKNVYNNMIQIIKDNHCA